MKKIHVNKIIHRYFSKRKSPRAGWAIHKIHYLILLDEEEKSLADSLSSKTQTGGDE